VSHLSVAGRANLFVAAFALLAMADGPSSHAEIVAGKITALNGSSTITRAAKSFPATYSASVDVADQLATSATGRLTVTLTDNSQLELTESSTLLVSEDLVNTNGTRVRTTIALMGGLLRSLVRVSAGSPNYEVHTPNAVAAARGTIYDTYYTDNTSRPGFAGCREFTDVLVYEGTIEVHSLANPTSPPVTVHSGQKTTVPCGLAPLSATALAAGAGTTGTAAGLSTAALAAGSLGSVAIVSGGVVGGLAAAGGLGGSSAAGPSPSPISKAAITATR
jgi:hypothetical protein